MMKLKLILLLYLFLTANCYLNDKAVLVSLKEENTESSPTPKKSFENFGRVEISKEDWKKNYEQTKEKILEIKKNWNDKNIKNYSFVIARYAGGTTNLWDRKPILVKVSDGNVTSEFEESVSDDDIKSSEKFGVSHIFKADWIKYVNTVEKMLTYSLEILDEGVLVSIECDKIHGYPKFIGFTFGYENHSSHSMQISKSRILKQ